MTRLLRSLIRLLSHPPRPPSEREKGSSFVTRSKCSSWRCWLQVVLLGVCTSSRPGTGAGAGADDLTLQPLPSYCASSDGVVMTCVATR